MKNVILTLVTVLAFNLGNAQDVITTKAGETIEAFKSTVKNVYDNDLRKWVKGIAYKDKNGNAKQIILSEVSEYKPCAETMLKINPVNEFKTELNLAGFHIEKGANTKNTAVLIALIGGGISCLGVSNNDMTMTGVGAFVASVSLPLIVIGNFKIAKGGRLLRNHKTN
tara:strand:- start:562 stop:1065 length:504 start_codon:yes stop_codon:yes gene_type:complete